MKILDLVPSWVWALVVAALLATGVGLRVQLASERHTVTTLTEQKSELELAISKANARAAEQSSQFANQVLKAKNEATVRESSLRRLAVAARAESDSLHNDLDTLRLQLVSATREAAVERATALSTVLDQCNSRYTGLAQVCDRHVSDIKTLIDSWPVAP